MIFEYGLTKGIHLRASVILSLFSKINSELARFESLIKNCLFKIELCLKIILNLEPKNLLSFISKIS